MHTSLLESETFSSLALLALQASAVTIARPVFPQTTANIFVATKLSIRLFFLIMLAKKSVLCGEPELSDLNRS